MQEQNQAQHPQEKTSIPNVESTAPNQPINQENNPDSQVTNQIPQNNESYFPDYQKPPQEEIVYQWQAPSRPFKKHRRQFFTTIATIVILLCLILFFAGQILPIAVVIAVAFLSYIMATIPPQTITNSITTYGIRNEEELYFWDELGRFWFEKKFDELVLYVEVSRFPFRLSILLGNETEETITEILSEILINQRPPLTETERLAQWLAKKIPIDIDS